MKSILFFNINNIFLNLISIILLILTIIKIIIFIIQIIVFLILIIFIRQIVIFFISILLIIRQIIIFLISMLLIIIIIIIQIIIFRNLRLKNLGSWHRTQENWVLTQDPTRGSADPRRSGLTRLPGSAARRAGLALAPMAW